MSSDSNDPAGTAGLHFRGTTQLIKVKSPYLQNLADRDAISPPSFDTGAEPYRAEAAHPSDWPRIVVDLLLGGAVASSAYAVAPPPVHGPAIAQTLDRSNNPPTKPPAPFARRDADLPARDDAPRFRDIVRKIADMAANMAIKEVFAMVAHYLWAAYHARRKHLTVADEDALSQLDRLLGDENSWVRHFRPFDDLPMPEEASKEQIIKREPWVSYEAWEEAGEQVVKNSHGPLHPFLCREKSPVGAGVDQVTDWIAERTRDALFSAASDPAILYTVAGIAVAIAKEGLDKICGEDHPQEVDQ